MLFDIKITMSTKQLSKISVYTCIMYYDFTDTRSDSRCMLMYIIIAG